MTRRYRRKPHAHHRNICKECEAQFFSVRAGALTCSVACRVAKHRKSSRRKRLIAAVDREAERQRRQKFWQNVDAAREQFRRRGS